MSRLRLKKIQRGERRSLLRSPARSSRRSLLRSAALSLLSGALLSLAYPEPDMGPVAWFALAPLLVVTQGERAGRAALLGLMFGASFFGTLLIWISLVGWVAWALLTVLQALFVALFAALWAVLSRRARPTALIVLPAVLWVAVEYLRAGVPVVGFTWGELAQSQHNLEWMLRPAALGGRHAVAFAVVVIDGAVALAIGGAFGRRSPSAPPAGALRAVLVRAGAAVAVAAGLPGLLPSPGANGPSATVAIVQGNVPRRFVGSSLDKDLAILDGHVSLTEGLPEGGIDLVVWPESSVGIDYRRHPEVAAQLGRAAQAVGAPMIVGANLDRADGRYLVMALLVAPTGEVVGRYQKTHLVPFGEYVPQRELLDFIPMLEQVPRDAVAGDEETVFVVAGGSVAPVISFEGDFGSLVRRRIDAGGRLLVVATNTSTWGYSWASAQHVAMSQVRAAENGVWAVHSALSGISAFISPSGRVVARTPLWTPATSVHEVRFATGPTFYARTGDWFAWMCAAIAVVALYGRVRVQSRIARLSAHSTREREG